MSLGGDEFTSSPKEKTSLIIEVLRKPHYAFW
jgi:hypothetical protein